jgi:hypothetical protein
VSEQGFDRLRRRSVDPGAAGHRPLTVDPLGRRVLYSVAEQRPALGAVEVECSGCRRTSVVTPLALVGLAVPSLHLPFLRGRHFSWLRCPACRKRTWVRLGLRL